MRQRWCAAEGETGPVSQGANDSHLLHSHTPLKPQLETHLCLCLLVRFRRAVFSPLQREGASSTWNTNVTQRCTANKQQWRINMFNNETKWSPIWHSTCLCISWFLIVNVPSVWLWNSLIHIFSFICLSLSHSHWPSVLSSSLSGCLCLCLPPICFCFFHFSFYTSPPPLSLFALISSFYTHKHTLPSQDFHFLWLVCYTLCQCQWKIVVDLEILRDVL